MRFACEHCGAKYSIADEKVRGKVLRIRCKKCSEIIKVREPAGQGRPSRVPPPTAAPGKTAPPPPPKPSVPPSALEDKFAASFKSEQGRDSGGTPGLFGAVKRSAEQLDRPETSRKQWFVAIDETPHGPISAEQVQDHRKGGRVDDSSLAWKEGMADWAPLRDCKELVGLLATLDLEAAGEEKTGDEGPRLGLFAAGESEGGEGPLKGRSVGLIDERTDEADEAVDVPAGPPPDQAAGATPGGDAENDFFASEAPRDTIDSLAPPRPGGAGQNRVVMFAAIGFFIVALGTLGVAIFSGRGETEPKTSVQIVEKVVEKVVYRDRPVAESESPEAEEGAPGPGSAKGSGGKRSRKKKKDEARTRELMERMGVTAPAGGAPIGGKQREAKGAGAPKAAAGKLSAAQLKGVVNKNKRGLQSCYERELKRGAAPEDRDLRVDFKVKVGSSGMVKHVNLRGDGAQVGSLNSCLTRTVKRWVFPPSSGDSDVEFPLTFTPSH